MNPEATFPKLLKMLLEQEQDEDDEWDRGRRQERREREAPPRDMDRAQKGGEKDDEATVADASDGTPLAGVPAVDGVGSDELAADAVALPHPPPEEAAAAAAAVADNPADEELPEEPGGDDADAEDMDVDMGMDGVEDDAEDTDDEDGYMNDEDDEVEAEEVQVEDEDESAPEPEVANNGNVGESTGFAIGDEVIISTMYDKKYAGASGIVLAVFPRNDDVGETANVGDICEAGRRVARNPIVTGILTKLLEPQENRSRTRSGVAQS